MALTTDLEAYWKLDETSGTTVYDATSNDNDGTISGATYTSSGKIGGAYDFDGSNDYIKNTSPSDLPAINEELTISFWFNSDSTSSTRQLIDILSSSGGLYIEIRNNVLRVSRSGGILIVSSGITPTTSNWHHTVYTYDGTTDKIYLDNSFYSSTGATKNTGATTSIVFGYESGGNQEYFDGKIDEVGIWSRALTSAEASSIYNSGDGLAYPFTTSTGYANKIFGITGCKINGVTTANINKVLGI